MIFTTPITKNDSPINRVDFDDTTDKGRIALHVKPGNDIQKLTFVLIGFARDFFGAHLGFKIENNRIYIGNPDDARYVVAALIVLNYTTNHDRETLITNLNNFSLERNNSVLRRLPPPQDVPAPSLRF